MCLMKSKLKKWMIASVIAGIGLFLVGYCFRDFWFAQVRIYVLGLAEVRAEQFGYRLPNVDELEVMALGEPDLSVPNGLERVANYAISGRAILRGEEAEKVATLWRSLFRGRGFSAMCHKPGYALRFRQRGKLLFETTVCWECHNYTIPVGIFGRIHYGFDATRKDAQSLLELLQSHVPLPAKPNAQADAAPSSDG